MDTDVLTVREVRARLRCGENYVYKLVREGRLAATKNPGRTGRILITRADFDAYLATIAVGTQKQEAASAA